MWWRDYYRAMFLAAMQRFGNRWLADPANVKAVGRLMAERAIEYAGQSPSIDKDCAMRASSDATRYCTLRAMRLARRAGDGQDGEETRIAGEWCLPYGI